MTDIKSSGPQPNLAMAPEIPAASGRQRVDLESLAAQLTAIASELRREAAVAPDRSSGTSLASIRQVSPLLRSDAGRRGSDRDVSGLAADNPSTSHHSHRQTSESLTQLRKTNAEYARQAYATRRRRSGIFGIEELFGEPAWDILLDLYIAYVDEKPVSVSSACIGSAAPPTTGLRWLGVLSEHGFVLREHDPEDQRRVLVRLTELGLAAMDEYFASARLSA